MDDAWLFGSLQEKGKHRSFAVDRAAGVRYATDYLYGWFQGVWDGRAVWLKVRGRLAADPLHAAALSVWRVAGCRFCKYLIDREIVFCSGEIVPEQK